jgi:MoxR-like ATPase
LSEEISSENLPDEIFKDFAKPLIEEYQESNANKKSEEDSNQETVRELQEKMLQLVERAIFERDEQAQTPNSISSFISTNATKEVEEALTNAISVRQKQREGVFPNKAVGLNGVLLEGDSGVGKSVLIEAVLASKGIKPATPENSASASESNLIYYKIDANLPLDKKKQIIIKAFEEGNIVWIDEINSCIDDGLEKILNAALTGDHPEGKSTENVKPGFMLISSVNSAGLEGRSIISPALRHRTTQPRVKGLKEYKVEDLTKIISHWISQDETLQQHQNQTQNHQKIAENFLKCLNSNGGERLNLRMLKSDLPKILTKYKELFSEPEINSDDLKKSLTRGVEEVLKKEGKISFTKASLGIKDSAKDEEKTITPQILNLEKLDQKLCYSEFGGLKFEENPENSSEKIFGKAKNLFFANFRGCTFENIDFSQIDSKILSTINFKKCNFNNCKFDENFVFKNSQITDFFTVNTKIKTEKANLHQQVPSNSFQPRASQSLSGIELSLERLRTAR